jgi:hypothetical protein
MIVDPKDLRTLFNLKVADITRNELFEMFAVTGSNSKPAIEMNAKVVIDDAYIKENGSRFALIKNYDDMKGKETTAGRILVHLFIFDIEYNFKVMKERDSTEVKSEHAGNLLQFMNFPNVPLTKKVHGGLDATLAQIFVDGAIDHSVMETYINRCQWLGYTCTVFTMPSLSANTVNPSKKIKAYRDKILKDNKDVIDRKDLVAFAKMEEDVLSFASKEMTDNKVDGKLIYDSGYNGVWSNNFKVTSIWRGIAPKSDNLNEFEIVTSNLVDGVAKRDIAAHADLAVLGAAGRAKDTQLGGYKTKIFNAAFSSIVADKEGTDCKSRGAITVTITEKNFKDYRYRYIVENGTLGRLDFETKDKYIGKTLKLRSPLYCTTEKVCNKCLGDMYYKLRIRNIGLHTSRITSSLMNASMKAFHNMSVDPDQYDLADYITPIP